MDQSLDGGLKPKNTNSWGTKNIINPKIKINKWKLIKLKKSYLTWKKNHTTKTKSYIMDPYRMLTTDKYMNQKSTSGALNDIHWNHKHQISTSDVLGT